MHQDLLDLPRVSAGVLQRRLGIEHEPDVVADHTGKKRVHVEHHGIQVDHLRCNNHLLRLPQLRLRARRVADVERHYTAAVGRAARPLRSDKERSSRTR